MEEKLRRKESESKLEYVKRIVYGKLKDKTIDNDYSELAPLVFDKEYSSDVARRMFYGARNVLDMIDESKINNVDDNEVLKEIQLKVEELKKQRMKLQSTKIEYNRNLRVNSRQELLYENIKDAKDRLPLPNFKDIPIKNIEGSYFLCWTDLHYGADFISENNIYSREECKIRLEKLAYKVKQMCIEKGINNLYIAGLSDDIQGLLRISDVKINDIPVVESVVEVSRLIASILNSISEVTNVRYYHTMASNHSQTRPITGKADLIKEDLEVIIGNYIQDLLMNNERVEVVLSDKDYHSITIENQNILLMHGHQTKSIKDTIKNYSMLHRKFYDLAFIGHYHAGQQMSVGESDNGNTEIFVVPSIVGSDPYSDTLKVGAKSMAKMFKIEQGNGVTENYTFVLN